MWDQVGYARNIADLEELLATSDPARLVRDLGPWRMIILQVATGSDRIDRFDETLFSAARERVGEQTLKANSDDEAAMRSLILRAVGRGREWPRRTEVAARFDAAFVDFAADWARRCAALPRGDGGPHGAGSLPTPRHVRSALSSTVRRHAPTWMRPAHRKPRIALCLSGQLRGYLRTLDTWRGGLLRGAEVHTFVHTWTRVGRARPEPWRVSLPFDGPAFVAEYRKQATGAGMEVMEARYPHLFLALRDTDRVSAASLQAFYQTPHVVVEDDDDPRFADWTNATKMHYKIQAAAALAERSGIEVDLVVRIRPDRAMGRARHDWDDLCRRTQTEPVIFTDAKMGYHLGEPNIGDQVAVGAPTTMALYAETFRLAPALAAHGAFHCRPELAGHVSLASCCWHAGIAVEHLPVDGGPLVEADRLSARVVADCIAADAATRMDATDRVLLAASARDLGIGGA
jgi:hypothetical protein